MDEATTLRLLAFVHPVWMVASLSVAIWTARLGLAIRRERGLGRPVPKALRARHLRAGQCAIAMIMVGFVLGPISMALFRQREWFESFHSILGLIVLGLFAWTGWSGRALARGDREARDVHRIAAGSSLAAGLLSAIAGFILLP